MQGKRTASRSILTFILGMQLIMTLIYSTRVHLPTGHATEVVNQVSNMLMEGDADSRTIYVPVNFSKIQEAIGAASPGDTICI